MNPIPVSTPGITVSLGYVKVQGFWKDLRFGPAPSWKSPKQLLHAVWKPEPPPVGSWK